MQRLIDCDSVFDILTQAPFPTGSFQDETVENHLRMCHDCRRLAEALRPAVGLIHETLAEDEALPRYTGRVAEGDLLHGGNREERRGIDWRGAGLAATLAACLLLWLSDGAGFLDRESPVPPGGISGESISLNLEGLRKLSALRLPPACLNGHARISVSPVAADFAVTKMTVTRNDRLANFVCCTQCHRSGGEGPATGRAMQALQHSCVVCHRSDDPARELSTRQSGWRSLRGKSLG